MDMLPLKPKTGLTGWINVTDGFHLSFSLCVSLCFRTMHVSPGHISPWDLRGDSNNLAGSFPQIWKIYINSPASKFTTPDLTLIDRLKTKKQWSPVDQFALRNTRANGLLSSLRTIDRPQPNAGHLFSRMHTHNDTSSFTQCGNDMPARNAVLCILLFWHRSGTEVMLTCTEACGNMCFDQAGLNRHRMTSSR